MAKKTSKKKSSGKPAKKTAGKKPAARGKGGAAGKAGGGMFKVSTGSGAGPVEIGTDLVALFNRGKIDEVERKHWSRKIESIEGVGVNLGWRGLAAVQAKNAEWYAAHEFNGGCAEGPYLGSSGFAVKFRMDITEKATGKRFLMEEVGVYTVQGGKIVREEFMYGSKTEQTGSK